ncbi:phosphoribosylformylglycinamidine synthase subunit PurS [Geoalkalibacter halelectricus]|uniref:Phosphoribosylformylglycinamidine synthase subunit PurL n=1 Tax=Geoalkalibacter halelectricus TaxID=2847045 RepID=A0ABY5ZRT8_9BACT|nr:phosphoribosylformylglycinamidine synthase subunit PurS [Geoalkalibacter halelectricus]MDO3379866.1 phosphoribosylformylglycinamidine synthase subunit PurS [Geoalkalibacter halelectricus]UWZ80605.1 phosphoribosylformylglycinamidine synthase subunit PurS [Geoalkalibacter halelectricus]
MPWRIIVGLKDGVRDARGERVRREISRHLQIELESVRTIDVYTVDAQLSDAEVEAAARGPFCDPVIQEVAVNRPLAHDFDMLIEVGFRPGVTDNVGRTAREAIQYLTGRKFAEGEGVYTSVQYLLKGSIDKVAAERIAHDFLGNALIQRWTILSRDEFDPRRGVPVTVPKVVSTAHPEVREIDLNVSDEELLRISKDGMLALNLEEMKAIQAYVADPEVRARRAQVGLGDKLTDAELEALAQTWSEHCKHKIFAARIEYEDGEGGRETIDSLFRNFIAETTREVRENLGDQDFCLSVFKDNAGVIRFNDDWSIAFKVETHNSPSALDPYGGALTGIVGVNRDAFGTGMGARLLFNTDVFCFASPFYDQPLPPRLLHPRRIFEGVVEGVEHGGNKSGIPTVNGSIVFDERFAGKPLVYCGTGSIMPATLHGKPCHEKKALVGDRIVMVGGRIGKDGIHGATFSSEELHEGSPATAVQIGDPITQRRMFDFLLVARDRGLYNSITDNGAGGLSSSVGEMSEDTGGFELHLDRAPLKYAGLQPWEILISEAQERMTLAVPPDKIQAFLQLAAEMDVEASDLGQFTSSGYFHCLYQGRTVTYLDMNFVHKGVPQLVLPARWQAPQARGLKEPVLAEPRDLGATLKSLLQRLNICSKESVVRRYDHEVQAGTVVKPLTGVVDDGPSDAAVVRPLSESFEGIVVSHGICPRYSDIDTYHMMACAIDEALRNYVAVGGDIAHVAGLDNFCWCDPVESEKTPDGAYKAAQLVRANKALRDYCVAFGVPLISGKDSMKNDYMIGDRKISIPPTVLFSVMGRMDDVRRAVTMDVKRPGDLVYLLGITRDELGASEYYALRGAIGCNVPRVDAPYALKLFQVVNRAQKQGVLASCHDLSDGGLGVALAETAFAGGLGLKVDLRQVKSEGALRADQLLFSETPSRFVVTVPAQHQAQFEEIFADVHVSALGRVCSEPELRITGMQGEVLMRCNIDELKAAWQAPLKEM